MMAFLEAVRKRNTLVENETLAFPEALIFGNPLQLPKNATMKVIHLLKT